VTTALRVSGDVGVTLPFGGAVSVQAHGGMSLAF